MVRKIGESGWMVGGWMDRWMDEQMGEWVGNGWMDV